MGTELTMKADARVAAQAAAIADILRHRRQPLPPALEERVALERRRLTRFARKALADAAAAVSPTEVSHG